MRAKASPVATRSLLSPLCVCVYVYERERRMERERACVWVCCVLVALAPCCDYEGQGKSYGDQVSLLLPATAAQKEKLSVDTIPNPRLSEPLTTPQSRTLDSI